MLPSTPHLGESSGVLPVGMGWGLHANRALGFQCPFISGTCQQHWRLLHFLAVQNEMLGVVCLRMETADAG